MENIKIESSNIKTMYYDEDKKELLVFFMNNSFYKYFNISKENVEILKKEINKTRYIKSNFLEYIKIY